MYTPYTYTQLTHRTHMGMVVWVIRSFFGTCSTLLPVLALLWHSLVSILAMYRRISREYLENVLCVGMWICRFVRCAHRCMFNDHFSAANLVDIFGPLPVNAKLFIYLFSNESVFLLLAITHRRRYHASILNTQTIDKYAWREWYLTAQMLDKTEVGDVNWIWVSIRGSKTFHAKMYA